MLPEPPCTHVDLTGAEDGSVGANEMLDKRLWHSIAHCNRAKAKSVKQEYQISQLGNRETVCEPAQSYTEAFFMISQHAGGAKTKL